MPRLNDLFPSNFLKADDIERDRVAIIDRIEFEKVGREKEEKAVVYFRGEKKGLILNKTCATAIATIAGSQDTNDWPGVQVQLFVTAVDFRDQLVNAIRVKAPPKTQAAARPSEHAEGDAMAISGGDIPF